MNGFIFASGVNSAKYPGDATGAFRPGAEAFKKIHNIPQEICYFDHNDGAAARKKILDKLRSTPCDDGQKLDVIAYFGHGIPRGLASASFFTNDKSSDVTSDVKELAAAIKSKSNQYVKVVLYACSAGALPHSFAGALSIALGEQPTVFGHTVIGHAFANACVSVWDNGHVGRLLVDPSDAEWKSWLKEINASNSADPTAHPLWAKFPFMTNEEIRERLGFRDRNKVRYGPNP